MNVKLKIAGSALSTGRDASGKSTIINCYTSQLADTSLSLVKDLGREILIAFYLALILLPSDLGRTITVAREFIIIFEVAYVIKSFGYSFNPHLM